MSLVILNPSGRATSFDNSNVVCPCPPYALVEVFLWEVGANCRDESWSSMSCRSALVTNCIQIRNKDFLTISSVLLKHDPFFDCTGWMSNGQKQLMCSQLGTKAAEVNSSSDCFLSSSFSCFVFYCLFLSSLMLGVQEYSIIYWKLLDL